MNELNKLALTYILNKNMIEDEIGEDQYLDDLQDIKRSLEEQVKEYEKILSELS
jgi:hypothetical protein